MTVLASYPLFTVARLAESRDFFTTHFEMSIVFEASWVVMLSHRDDGSLTLGLISSDHPSKPPGPEPFDGRGMILTVQVDDATSLHTTMLERRVPIAYPLTVEPWGQRRFMLMDPSGISVDVVEQIEAAPGFWDQYLG
jgi:uncharacterized glyoxalase superfamily protein PhnB